MLHGGEILKNEDFRKLFSAEKCWNFLSNHVQEKCLTKGKGSENLGPLMSIGKGLRGRKGETN